MFGCNLSYILYFALYVYVVYPDDRYNTSWFVDIVCLHVSIHQGVRPGRLYNGVGSLREG